MEAIPWYHGYAVGDGHARELAAIGERRFRDSSDSVRDGVVPARRSWDMYQFVFPLIEQRTCR